VGLSNPKLTEDYLVALLRANRYVYENRSGTVAIIRDFFKAQSGHAERVYEYWVRDKVIPANGAMTVPGTEVALAILDQLGDFKARPSPKPRNTSTDELLDRARKRMQ
jgi:hypothetical protein